MWKWIKALNPFAVQLRNTEARLEFARGLLAQAEIELADKAFYVREFAAVSAERDALMAENAALRERASVPEPASVPEVKALREIGINAYLMHEQAKRENVGCIVGPMEAAATAIRDAVLAGVAGEQTVTMIGKPLTADTFGPNDGIAPTDDQVGALARVLHAAEPNMPPATYKERNEAMARAAIAHLSKRPEGLPTAEELKAAHQKYIEGYRKGENDGSMCATDFALEYLRPFLREPVGWELDVTAEELTAKLWGFFDADKMSNEILDLCRKRIRPVYECKECERRSNMIPQIIADVTAAAAGATRAALEANP